MSPSAQAATVDASSQGGVVYVNEVQVLTFRSGSAESVASRAQAVAQRLAGKSWSDGWSLSGEKDDVRITNQGTNILTVTKAEAAANSSTPSALAGRWMTNIAAASRLQPYDMDGSSVKLDPGKVVSWRFQGSHARKATIFASPTGIVSVTKERGVLKLVPRQAGTTKLTFRNNGVTGELEVTVLAPSAQLPQHFRAEVMGTPALPETVHQAVLTSVRQRLQVLDPSARVEVGALNPSQLMPGQNQTYQVPVKVSAPGRATTEGRVTVAVQNIGAGRMYEDRLWYSNVPENIDKPEHVYWGQLEPNSPTRILIHHYNRTTIPMIVQYVVANRGSETAKIAVLAGDQVHDANPTLAGYLTGMTFFRRWLDSSAEVVLVPPNSVVPLFFRPIQPKETASGLVSLQLVGNSGTQNVSVSGHVVNMSSRVQEWTAAMSDPFPWSAVRPRPAETYSLELDGTPKEVYPDPVQRREFEYAVGGRLSFIRIGQNPIAGVEEEKSLSGNFGVTYIVEGVLTNPTSETKDVEVVFEASAGYSGAMFAVNGKFVRGKIMQAKETMELFRTTLPPGGQAKVTVVTVPLSGAHYPATLTARTVGQH